MSVDGLDPQWARAEALFFEALELPPFAVFSAPSESCDEESAPLTVSLTVSTTSSAARFAFSKVDCMTREGRRG